MAQTRSKEQLAVMLKLIQCNEDNLMRGGVRRRQKMWRTIAQKLNAIPGAEKDLEAWKRSYTSWRANMGANYQQEVKRLTRNVPDDDYFFIPISDDDDSDYNDDTMDELQLPAETPFEKQKNRLGELVAKQQAILRSSADDEALKDQIWYNIAGELNAIAGGVKMTPHDWRKHSELDKFKLRKGRKAIKRIAPTLKSLNYASDRQVRSSKHDTGRQDDEYVHIETEPGADGTRDDQQQAEQVNVIKYHQPSTKRRSQQTSNYDVGGEEEVEEEMLLSDEQTEKSPPHDGDVEADKVDNDHERDKDEQVDDDDDDDDEDDDDDDDDDIDYMARVKRMKPTPIVNAYKFSHRVVNAVEKLSGDVHDVKTLLKKQHHSLASIEAVLKEQCKKQDETNALLKRNSQLLRVLVEYKMGKRTK